MVQFERTGVSIRPHRRSRGRQLAPLTHDALCWQPETDARESQELHGRSSLPTPTNIHSFSPGVLVGSPQPAPAFCAVSRSWGSGFRSSSSGRHAAAQADSCGSGDGGGQAGPATLSLSNLRTSIKGHRRCAQPWGVPKNPCASDVPI